MTPRPTDDEYLALMRVTVPERARGCWLVERFEVTEPLVIRGTTTPPGRYTALRKLEFSATGVGIDLVTWMSDVPEELREALVFVKQARGRVLVTGLGLGSILLALAANPDVTEIVVIEKEESVYRLTASDRWRVILADALTVNGHWLGVFDSAWHDIWPTITAMNLKDMILLLERWPVRGLSMCWSRDNVFKQLADEAAKGRLPGNILHLACEAYEAAVRVGQHLAKVRDEAEEIRRVR